MFASQPRGPFRAITRRAFSLLELSLVVAFIGIMAAVAVPKISEAARSARISALQSDVTIVRHAIRRYYLDHGRYPGYDPSTGDKDDSFFIDQLTQYTDEAGYPAAEKDGTHVYGPYLPGPFPVNPINGFEDVYIKDQKTDTVPAGDYGWVIVLDNGSFGVRSSVTDVTDFGVVDADEAERIVGDTRP